MEYNNELKKLEENIKMSFDDLNKSRLFILSYFLKLKELNIDFGEKVNNEINASIKELSKEIVQS